jgi:hypothetical protein
MLKTRNSAQEDLCNSDKDKVTDTPLGTCYNIVLDVLLLPPLTALIHFTEKQTLQPRFLLKKWTLEHADLHNI